MKIVQLITGSSSFGGAEAHVRELAIGLKSRGHECIVLAGPPAGLLSKQLSSAGIEVVEVPSLEKPIHLVSDFLSLTQIIALLRRLKPDILAAHTAKAGFVGRIAAKVMGIPHVFTPHGMSFVDRKTGNTVRLLLALEQVVSGMGGKIIAVCEAERVLALKYLRLNANRIVTIHNGLPDNSAIPERRRAPVCITMIARFGRQKDHATLVEALSRLPHLDWELRLAGVGDLLPAAKLLVEQKGLASRVHFLNECDDIPQLLSETDIFTLITHFEAFPISILEAMRASLPVVATNTGGICEAVEDGSTGFLVDQADVSTLAERMEILITSEDLRKRMGAASRARFTQHFEWRCMLDRTEALYAETVPQALKSRFASSTSA